MHFFPSFALLSWNTDIKDVAPAAILNHEVTWILEAMNGGEIG